MTPSPNPSCQPESAADIPSSLILIVDDVPDNLKLLWGLLVDTGHQLTFATSGQQALERARTAQPDLILLDLMMPEMDGLEVCQRLKQSAETATIPIIFLTASHQTEHLIQAFDYGAVDYITKPFRSSELLARLRTHLTLRHLQRQTQQQAAWEAVRRRVVESLHSSLNLATVLSNAVVQIQAFTQAQRALVCRRITPEEWVMATVSDDSEPVVAPPAIDPQALPTGIQLSMAAPEELAPADSQWLGQWQVHTEIRLPLWQGNFLWGALMVHLDSDQQDWDISAALLQPIAEQLAIAIHKAELHAQLQTTHAQLVSAVEQLEQANASLSRLANLDGLTQLANRHHFNDRITQEWERLRREQQPLSLILIDIDYFKLYNDTYGHLQGDICLQAVAQALQQIVRRPADLVARYGGEEFVGLFPNTETPGAQRLAQAMQQAVAQLNIPHQAHLSHDRVTLSMGIATAVPNPDISWSDLLNQADQALYQTKANGRNGYYVADLESAKFA